MFVSPDNLRCDPYQRKKSMQSCNPAFYSAATEPGALELACVVNAVQDVIVCGHSDCKAMNLLQSLRAGGSANAADFHESPLRSWLLRYGGDSWTHFETMLRAEKNRLVFMEGHHAHEAVIDPKNEFVTADKFSQVSTLHQLENITSYPFMQRLVDGGLVRLHAMWFDIYTGNIFYFSKPHKMFTEITEDNWDDFLDEKQREAMSKQKLQCCEDDLAAFNARRRAEEIAKMVQGKTNVVHGSDTDVPQKKMDAPLKNRENGIER